MLTIKSLGQIILNCLWPLTCCSCHQDVFLLCPDCQEQITLRDKKQCPLCKGVQKNTEICPACQSTTALSKIIICTDYENSIIQKTIQAYKYQYLLPLAEPLAAILIKKFEQLINQGEIIIDPKNKPLIIPTPLHRQRQWERGFNQSAQLAKIFARYFGFDYNERIIQRKRNTTHQAELNREKRLQNMINSFQITHANAIQNRIIILIDDVITTGATLNEQAKILKENGAAEIWALVIAKN
ncbi:MAG: hypothetical protein COX77_01560 [Candidatus Komeilibacteria bacterium CG_4_10_14_0_2_um_filter_37_10]|uniref:Phosphoribosyltransferase domain-containing protein n=1 Tax=Candidatus Komeilibacteria bacterium CG_4_10_14_0_2_um_filter_37_10 TaxID=1974470 RepID=A0A2M7VFV9_9BACT|nr:MAG: hypothetical protein COX77_01560 [Candidatus Komeilibacteria bacterium CG_4_10_14_0_2_um_filter_37_10]